MFKVGTQTNDKTKNKLELTYELTKKLEVLIPAVFEKRPRSRRLRF